MRGRRHSALREATSAAHAAVDAAVTDGGFLTSPAGYRGLLRRLHLFHCQLERSLPPEHAAEFQLWGILHRGAWLKADLAALRAAPLRRRAPTALPRLATQDDVLGALYVLIGATLGARVLVERLARYATPDGGGLIYFSEMSRSRHWPEFLAALETAPVICEARLARGAVAMFDSLRQYLSGPRPA